MRFRIALLAVCASLLVNSAEGHDTWLAPELYRSEVPVTVTLSLTSGMEFPKLDYAIRSDRVAAAKQQSGDGAAGLGAGHEAAHALEFTGSASEGVNAYWVVLHPRPSELEAGQVREYVRHLGLQYPDSAIAEWERDGAGPVRYRYTKYSKTFVRTGVLKHTVPAAVGMALEIVPEADPTSLTPTGTLPVRLLRDGSPLTNYPVTVVHESSAPAHYTTDDAGRVRLEIGKPGRYMARATTLRRSDQADYRWEVDFTTLTFEARRPQATKD